MKHHVKVIEQIDVPAPCPPKLKMEVNRIIQNNYRADIEWLKRNYGIDFTKNFSADKYSSTISKFDDRKATVREIYQIDDEGSAEHYEAVVINKLIKRSVQNLSNASTLRKTFNFLKFLIPRK